MYDEPIRETARQRAERMWRNNYIIHQSHTTQPEGNETIFEVQSDNRRLNQIRSRLAREIKETLVGTQNKKTIAHYILSIKSQKYRLLREKLRRLERNQDG
jgi:hypothetical protein